MLKLPEIKVGIVAVSRDCFPVTLSKERKERVVKEYGKGLYNCSVVVENDKDVLAALGIPVACETDIYGALTEFILECVSDAPAMLLDINNTVPADLAKEVENYRITDLFMGFHCGNGSPCLLKKPKMKYQLIMKRSLEPDGEPDITRGTLEGEIADGKVTLFRLQSGADTRLKAYIAEGEVLDLPTHTFGTVGVFAVHEMGRFYRHVLIENNVPHHAGVARGNVGKALFEVLKLLGVANVGTPRPADCLYPDENPF